MQNFIKHFVRQNQGVWLCVEPAGIQLPQGRVEVAPGTRITAGSRFMGVELAQLLEEQYEKDCRRPA
jgi:hypothetical protein